MWTTLGAGEAVFLEAAEDVDRRADGSVEAGQVKALAAPLTLRSKAVREALVNFWDLRGRNPGLRPSFVLLTTARRGVEAGRPFGDTPGLDEWDRCRFVGADPTALRAFLVALDLGGGVDAFLRSATDHELRDGLVRPIRWATGEPDRTGVRERIEERVVLHGDRQGLTPSQSRPAVDHLYTKAWEMLTSDGPRRLDRVSFLDAFEQATVVPTARSVLASPGTGGGLAARVERVFAPDVRPLVSSPVARRSVVQDVVRQLAASPALCLTGASGLGKSTLAALVASVTGDWVRLDLRGFGEGDAADRLDLAVLAGADLAPGTSVLVDDLPAATLGRVEHALVHLIYATAALGGRVLVTSHGCLPGAALAATGQTDSDAHVEVPAFSPADLRDLCLAHGCPPDRSGRWARVIEVQTGGHPQLAAAHARSASERGWGDVSEDDLFGTPPTIERVKRDARRRLVSTLAGLGASDLAYRLSLFATPFTRTHALRLAEAPPRLPGSGDALDVLIGPWIEQVDDEHFRVSPLLSKGYESQFDPDTVKRLHHAAARSFIDPVLDQRALSGLLLHGMAGECDDALVAAFGSVNDVDPEALGPLAEWVSWFAYVAVEEPQPLYPATPLVSLFLRHLQLRIALALRKQDAAVAVARAAIREIEDAERVDGDPTPGALRFTIASLVVTGIEAPEHFAFVLSQAAAAARTSEAGALREMEAAAEAAGIETARFDDEFAAREGIESLDDLVGPLVRTLSVRVRSPEAFTQLLDVVEAEPAMERALAPLFQRDAPAASAMTDGIWLDAFRAEKAGERVDFEPAASALRRALAVAEDHGYGALEAAARRSLATVLNEHQGSKEEALDVLAAGGDRVGLLDYRAKMHVLDGELEDALDLYRRLFPRWEHHPDRMDSARAHAYHDAVWAAGELGRFDEAATLAEEGARVAVDELARIDSPLSTGYRADRALALYRSGRPAEAVPAFEAVLDVLAKSPERGGFGLLRDRVGHTLGILERELTRRSKPEGYVDPYVGLFSKPEPEFNDFEAPVHPTLAWGRLAHIERLVSPSRAVSRRFLALSDGDPDPLVAYDRAQHRAALAVQTGSPNLVSVLNEAHHQAARSVGVAEAPPFDADLVFGAASIRAAADLELATLPVDTWAAAARDVLADDPVAQADVDQWVETVMLAIALQGGNRRAAPPLHLRLLSEDRSQAVRATAAAALALHAKDPDTVFRSKVAVLQVAEQRAFSDVLERPVSRLVTGDPSAGYAASAAGLLASQTRMSLSPSLRQYVERVASGVSSRE